MSISNGQETLRTAQGYLGAHEGAPNKSGAPIVNECQAMFGWPDGGYPWCNMFVAFCIANSGAASKYKTSAKSIMSPSTQTTADKAKAKGWLLPGNGKAKPGDMFVIPGLHIGFVASLQSGNLFTSIEGNHQDSVSSVTRSWADGWQRISLPDVGEPGPAAVEDGYGFDDTRVKLYGGWPTKEQRDGQLAKYAAANPDQWTQAVKVETSSPYAFRAGPPGTYSHWSFGPWMYETGKAIRDDQMKAYEAANKITARPWKKTYKES